MNSNTNYYGSQFSMLNKISEYFVELFGDDFEDGFGVEILRQSLTEKLSDLKSGKKINERQRSSIEALLTGFYGALFNEKNTTMKDEIGRYFHSKNFFNGMGIGEIESFLSIKLNCFDAECIDGLDVRFEEEKLNLKSILEIENYKSLELDQEESFRKRELLENKKIYQKVNAD